MPPPEPSAELPETVEFSISIGAKDSMPPPRSCAELPEIVEFWIVVAAAE